MSTIDSLVKFKYKKKFSFKARHDDDDDDNNNNNNNDADDDGERVDKSRDRVEEEEEEESTRSSSTSDGNNKKNAPKGSARLKTRPKKKTSSDDDEEYQPPSNSSNSRGVTKLPHTDDDDDDDEEDASGEIDAKKQKDLNKIYRIFPDRSRQEINKAFKRCKYNAKLCIDTLLVDESSSSDDDEIDEWSDGDEKIRATNQKKKEERRVKKPLASSSESSTSSLASSSNASSVNNNRKRKFSSDVESVDNVRGKKPRRVIVDSDEGGDGGIDDESSRSSESSSTTKRGEQNEQLNGVGAGKSKKPLDSSNDSSSKENKYKGAAATANTMSEKHSKKKNKSKKKEEKKMKKTKKKSSKASGSESNQDDSDFGQGGENDDENSNESDEDGFNYSEKVKTLLVTYFQTAKLEELQAMVQSKKLETVIALRPFRSFKNLRDKLKSKSMVNLIDALKEALDARDMVDSLFAKCEQISSKMQSKVKSLIESQGDGSKNKHNLEINYQPKNLNKALELKPYQLVGLNWLCLMHKENLNAILADEMGLGKTCQTIAFLAHLLQTAPRMLNLIVVPPSTLDNWVREISTWCPDFYFTVYQGSLDERRTIRYNVLNDRFEKPLNGLLTTYTMLISTNDDKAFFKKLDIGYVIYDEAHMLKNMNSLRYQGLIKIKSKGKLLLTGTPLQNNLVELMSLLYFVMPNMFHHNVEHLKQVFGFSARHDAEKDWFYKEKIEQAKGIMQPFILRRVKADVLKQLPKKVEEIIYCDMSRQQAKEYKRLVDFYNQRKEELLKELEAKREAEEKAAAAKAAGSSSSSSSSSANQLLQEISEIVTSTANLGKKKADMKKENDKEDSSSNIIMELRKTANHPLLRRIVYDDETVKKMAKLITKEQSGDTVLEYVIEDLSVMNDFQIHKLCPLYKCLKGFELKSEQILDSGKLVILDSLLQEKKENGQKVLIFSQFVIALDIIEEFMKIKKHKFVRLDGTTPVNERQDLIDYFNHDKDVFVFLLSTKAGGMGINLTAANVVILHDIDYNPYNDKQAEDRCHRVGQTKEVQVYKLLSKNSIDETMLRIQQRKINLGLDLSGETADAKAKLDMVSLLKEALKF